MPKNLKKEQLVVVLLVGILLLIIALPTKEKEKDSTSETSLPDTEKSDTRELTGRQMETELEQALSNVEGIGKVQVVLTFEDTGEKVVEKDSDATVYAKDSKGNQTPYVSTEILPRIKGVLVIAQGGDNAVVNQNIREAVMALFQVEAHKIKVMKMK
nr:MULTISPECIES: stage III sporulation protein AG [Lactonifactor]